MDIICVRIKELRTKENFTQKQLAQLLGRLRTLLSRQSENCVYFFV